MACLSWEAPLKDRGWRASFLAFQRPGGARIRRKLVVARGRRCEPEPVSQVEAGRGCSDRLPGKRPARTHRQHLARRAHSGMGHDRPIRTWPYLTMIAARSGESSTDRKRWRVPTLPPGETPRDHRHDWPASPRCLTPCQPVPPSGRAGQPSRRMLLLQHRKRKGPLPDGKGP